MPTLSRQQQRLATRQLSNERDSIDRNEEDLADQFWLLEDDDDDQLTQTEMAYPVLPFGKAPSKQSSTSNLRIQTYPKATLHERYMSSEEEPSPGPDSESESASSEDKDEPAREEEPAPEQAAQPEPATQEAVPEKTDEDVVEPVEYTAEIAIAVPIMAIGRPKLVDITNLAPMHKRKRSLEKSPLAHTAIKNAAAAVRVPAGIDENTTLPLEQPTIVTEAPEEHPLRHYDSQQSFHDAPDSWLPDHDGDDELSSSALPESSSDSDHYFPELEIRKPPTYNDYDPYSLNPPRLSPRNSQYSRNAPSPASMSSAGGARKPGNIARARKQATGTNPMLRRTPHNRTIQAAAIGAQSSPGWKGITRTLSMAKRQEAMHPREAKKPKMFARGATERTQTPTIPPFPFEEAKAVVVG